MTWMDVEDLAYRGEWPLVFAYALADMRDNGAPEELIQKAADALHPLNVWFDDTEPERKAQRKAQALAERERWLKEEEARWAPVRADEAAWAEHLRKLAEIEGRGL